MALISLPLYIYIYIYIGGGANSNWDLQISDLLQNPDGTDI